MNKKLILLLKKIYKEREKYWNLAEETAIFINLTIKDRKYKTALEIGTSTGYSGLWIAAALSKTKGHLYTIESHEKERFSLARNNFQKSGLKKYITQILGHAPKSIPKIPKYFDFILFDATKYEYPSYFKVLKNRVKKGGMIIADNINSHRKELLPYMNILKKSPQYESFQLDIGTGILVSVK
ncbi:class I SAM-dependent methyltransferase [Candidatus Peregrinibacteria bacterium]|nr:class I SAM-dependent methyltransferase [Candidatus Peregrinibacteria bacterium]